MTSVFPLNPQNNDTYLGYFWDGEFWKKQDSDFFNTNYLEESTASATYLTQVNASTTYATKTELNNIDLSSASAAAVSAIVDSAPETLNTLNELAAALGDDANYASTITTSLGNKLDISTASATYLTQANASTTYQPIVASVSDIEIGYLDGVTSAIQTQIDSKLSESSASTTYATKASPTFTGNINTSGIIQQDGNAIVQIINLATPVIHEVSFNGTVDTSLTLNATIPLDARFILADVFVTAGISDHMNVEMGNVAPGSVKNWVDTRGSQPSSQFGNLQRQTVIMTYNGEADGYTPNYGMWYSSQIIPVTNRTLYYGNYGNSGSSGWIYWRIRGYSK